MCTLYALNTPIPNGRLSLWQVTNINYLCSPSLPHGPNQESDQTPLPVTCPEKQNIFSHLLLTPIIKKKEKIKSAGTEVVLFSGFAHA